MALGAIMIAAGFGCRASCSLADVRRALELALCAGQVSLADVMGLFAAEVAAAPALRQAAAALGKPLVLLPLAALERAAPAALTRSARVMERFGLPSIAETAALAGLLQLAAAQPPRMSPNDEPRAQLLSPRLAAGGATCALARRTEEK